MYTCTNILVLAYIHSCIHIHTYIHTYVRRYVPKHGRVKNEGLMSNPYDETDILL